MTDLQFDFSAHAAVVTGAGAGVGRAVALALGAAGAAVVCGDINPDRADEVADAIRGAGGRALAWQVDVANRFQVAGMIESGRDAFGRLDLLVCAAGVYKHGGVLKFDEWDWRRVMDVNVTGTFFALQLLGRVMADEGGGAVVTFSSNAASPLPLDEGVAYATSKSGIVGMSVQAAHEFAPHGVRVNVITLGDVVEDDGPPRSGAALAPEAVAPLALFLCSDAARAITGQRFAIG